ncbi:hypothetical protein PFZ49_00850 [Microbacterium lacticum]|uniref:Uncharacterized protein n=1 Tax=Microbacterium lacticum TaxID=33885 RepID=A0A4Y3ULB1_9MICO|nr:hypothetical protein [Microbacterium lacticum]TQM91308.1 hypothetical protein FHX68_2519 [Microbacterium lacticum]GEB95751.1 hypothetical protein MLA01_19700 [Microbacterium lacticum]GGN16567.1 hypothetical protein GCM10009724_07930 [Microbacterium lacticum]
MITGSSTSRAARTTQRSKALTIATVMTVLTTALTLSGCGAAPWAQGTDGPSPSASSTAVPEPVPNDLSTGSTQRTLTAGAVTATVDYWSELSMDKWTPGALKPLKLSLVTTITPSDGQKVYLQRATMVAVPGNAAGALAALDPQIDQATIPPGYLVLSPYSYSQQFTVGAVPDEATFVTLELTYDFLVQTTPTSTEYAKQTATDTLTVAIAH